MSILSMISQFVTPSLLGQVASMLGTQPNTVEKAMNGAVPGLLATMLGATKTPHGQDAFARALKDQDPTMLDNLSGMLGAQGSGIAGNGSDMLSNIIGGGQLGVFSSKLKDLTGLPTGAAGSVSGLAGAVIMGALGKVAKRDGLDANGVLSLLGKEAPEISKAMPADFRDSFRGAGLLGAFDDLASAPAANVSSMATTAKPAAPQPRTTTTPASRTAAPVAPGRPWWQWALGALVLLALLGWLLGWFGGTDVADQAADATGSELVVDGTDIGAGIRTAMADLDGTIASITDGASAQEALPRLTTIEETLQGLGTSIQNLSAEGRSELKEIIDTSLPDIQQSATALLDDADVSGCPSSGFFGENWRFRNGGSSSVSGSA